MATTMHRLQVSLPEWQAQYLAARAEKEGVSIAEVVRRLVTQDAEATEGGESAESLWEIAGIGEESQPLIDDIPVSERPELYLTAPAAASPPPEHPRRRRSD